MNSKIIIKNIILVSIIFIGMISCTPNGDYKDPTQPVYKRVADLLSKMTVEEKVAQLESMHAGRPMLNDALLNNPKKMDSLFRYGIGMMNPTIDVDLEKTVKMRNALQNYLRTKTRLGIPVIYIDEAHHGLCSPGADVFPHGIGLAVFLGY